MKQNQLEFTIRKVISKVIIAAVALGAGGWIANIVKIVGSDFGHITGMLVMRIIGVFVAPLGAVLGFF